MNYLIYNNDVFLAELPEWSKQYTYVVMYVPYAESPYIIAFNEYYISRSNNLTYGTWHDTYAVNGMKSVYTSGAWGEPVALTGNTFIRGESPYMNDGNAHAKWSNVDIPCLDDNDVEYVILKGTEPIDPTPPDIIYPHVPITIDKNSFLLGNYLRRLICGKVDPRKPVQYQYGSTKLPVITLGYDKHKYPYSMIVYSSNSGYSYYTFYAFSSIEYRSWTANAFFNSYGIQCYDLLSLSYNTSSKKWADSFTRIYDSQFKVTIYTTISGASASVLWANFPVKLKDGSEYEPYTPTPIY